jgi:L-ascorbate metabolism protein UlaG (beta-lactamase superfamily)
MKIYYVYHSCFIIETESSFLIFDYFNNKSNPDQDFDFNQLINNIFNSQKPLYVFSSHDHHDHFNSDILSWCKEKENTYYILSNDIKLYNSIDKVYRVSKNEEYSLNNLKINTFGSTDEGISFLINIDNLNIFHAGDLNWWKWMDDSPEEEKEMESAFKNIIKDILIKDIIIDIAFFPVDKRLENNYLCGGQYFIENLNPKIFIPMHFWENFNVTSEFKKSLSNSSTNIIEINHNNEILLS